MLSNWRRNYAKDLHNIRLFKGLMTAFVNPLSRNCDPSGASLICDGVTPDMLERGRIEPADSRHLDNRLAVREAKPNAPSAGPSSNGRP